MKQASQEEEEEGEEGDEGEEEAPTQMLPLSSIISFSALMTSSSLLLALDSHSSKVDCSAQGFMIVCAK